MISVITPVRARSPVAVDWLIDAVKSVVNQTYPDWEMIICNDQSEADMDPLRKYLSELSDSRIRGCKTEDKPGVCNARNTAARHANGDLLLPLDADDVLPPNSMKDLLEAWEGEGIVYGDTLLFGKDFQKRYKSKPYSFKALLGSLIMPVGSLHLKSDWEKIGGWNPEMEQGLEDWEYWIRMGEHGVCGKHISKITYHYRRCKAGRYMSLRSSNTYGKAYQTMRQLHIDTYNGRLPMGCCGGRTIKKSRSPSPTPSSTVTGTSESDTVQVLYTGGRKGSFRLVGKPSGTRYLVPGTDKLVVNTETNQKAVDERDASRLVRLNRGRDFRIA